MCDRKRGYGGQHDKYNFWISAIFYVKSPMSIEMTLLDFHLSTDNKNGSQLATDFSFSTKLKKFLKHGIYRFVGTTSLLALSVIM